MPEAVEVNVKVWGSTTPASLTATLMVSPSGILHQMPSFLNPLMVAGSLSGNMKGV